MLHKWHELSEHYLCEFKRKKKKTLEPSGITTFIDEKGVSWIYLVSDNGKLARCKLSDLNDKAEWEIQKIDECGDMDFESICTVHNTLLIGIESIKFDGNLLPMIKAFTPDDNGTVASCGSWVLTDATVNEQSGMEAMTLIPDGHYPSSWGSSLFYGGLVITAMQLLKGKLLIYNLPEGNNEIQRVTNHRVLSGTPILPDRLISDMFYSTQNSRLYILYNDYDNKSGKSYPGDIIQEIRIDLNTGELIEECAVTLSNIGHEALTVHDGALYLGIDQNKNERDLKQKRIKSNINYIIKYS